MMQVYFRLKLLLTYLRGQYPLEYPGKQLHAGGRTCKHCFIYNQSLIAMPIPIRLLRAL